MFLSSLGRVFKVAVWATAVSLRCKAVLGRAHASGHPHREIQPSEGDCGDKQVSMSLCLMCVVWINLVLCRQGTLLPSALYTWCVVLDLWPDLLCICVSDLTDTHTVISLGEFWMRFLGYCIVLSELPRIKTLWMLNWWECSGVWCSASSCGSNLLVVGCYCCLRFTRLVLWVTCRYMPVLLTKLRVCVESWSVFCTPCTSHLPWWPLQGTLRTVHISVAYVHANIYCMALYSTSIWHTYISPCRHT